MADILYIFSGSPLLYALILLIALVAFRGWKPYKSKYKFIILGVLGLGIITVFLFSFINNQQELSEQVPPEKSGYALTLKEVWGVKSWVTTVERPGTDYPHAVLQTSDGGYVIAGRTNNGTKDCYGRASLVITFLIKTAPDGSKIWEKTGYKGLIVSIQQTSDGGLVAAGSIAIPGNRTDIYLVKTDAEGNVFWEKSYGESDSEGGFSIRQTSDGGYIVVGGTGRRYENQGIYLLKVDGNGNKLWSRIFAKDLKTDEEPHLVQQTSDGGYLVVGWRKSQGMPDINSIDKYIGDDVYLLKTDADGNKIWEKAFKRDETRPFTGRSVKQTADGGYIVVANTFYTSTPVYQPILLVKTDANGNV